MCLRRIFLSKEKTGMRSFIIYTLRCCALEKNCKCAAQNLTQVLHEQKRTEKILYSLLVPPSQAQYNNRHTIGAGERESITEHIAIISNYTFCVHGMAWLGFFAIFVVLSSVSCGIFARIWVSSVLCSHSQPKALKNSCLKDLIRYIPKTCEHVSAIKLR